MRKTLCLLLLIIFSIMLWVIGCGPQYWSYHQGIIPTHIMVNRIPVWVDNSFSVIQRDQIDQAIAEWNMVFNGQIVLQTNPSINRLEALHKLVEAERVGIGWVIISSNEEMLMAEGIIEEGDGILAFVYHLGGHLITVVRDRVGSRDFKIIMMHEMGHLFGANHVNTISLMAPRYGSDQVDCIDKITVAQVAKFNRLSFDTLNYCLTPGFE